MNALRPKLGYCVMWWLGRAKFQRRVVATSLALLFSTVFAIPNVPPPYNALYVALALSSSFAVGAWMFCVAVYLTHCGEYVYPPGLCQKCGYPNRGSPDLECPECGHPRCRRYQP